MEDTKQRRPRQSVKERHRQAFFYGDQSALHLVFYEKVKWYHINFYGSSERLWHCQSSTSSLRMRMLPMT